MDKKNLINRLNWFYSLELNQVEMYKAQSREADDLRLARALNKFARIEQDHVDKIRSLIEELGETPSPLWEAAGELTGHVAGKLSGLTAREKTLRFNIALERKAVHDYQALIKEVDDPGIKDVLWDNLLDEELHKSWMLEYLHNVN